MEEELLEGDAGGMRIDQEHGQKRYWLEPELEQVDVAELNNQ